MPVIAIIGAVVADVALGSAVVAGTVGTLTGILTAVSAVGATVGAIGAVTGNKALSYAGMALGAIGAVGAIASAAGVFGSAADLAGGTAPALSGPIGGTAAEAGASSVTSAFNSETGAVGADTIDQVTSGFAGGTAPALSGPIGGTVPGADATNFFAADIQNPNTAAGPAMVNDAGQATQVQMAPAAGAPAQQSPVSATGQYDQSMATPLKNLQGNLNQAEGNTAGVQQANQPAVVTGSNNPQVPPAGPANTPVAAGGPQVTDSTGYVDNGTFDVTNPTASSGGIGGIIGKIMQFSKDNQLLTYGATQALGNFISGATNTVTPAQVAQLNAQAASNNAAAALLTRQTAAQSQPKTVASLAPVTGVPAPLLTPSAPGLINVTGYPA